MVVVRWSEPRTENESPRFLILRAYRNWDFPKGRIEEGEGPIQAAVRELEEETGLSGARFHWGEHFVETLPYAGGKIARYYLAEVPQGEAYLPVSAELGRPEHHELRWVDAAQARKLLPPRLIPVLNWALQTLAKAGRPR